MPVFTSKEIRKKTDDKFKFSTESNGDSIIENLLRSQEVKNSFDIFLSHNSQDAYLVMGVKLMLEELDYSVYVDWVNDSNLDRENVNSETANLLKTRMASSKSLLYLTTKNSKNSKWMPWECGFFDGLKGKVAIIPVMEITQDDFNGQEYLGLYPWLGKENESRYSLEECLWINPTDQNLEREKFESWIEK